MAPAAPSDEDAAVVAPGARVRPFSPHAILASVSAGLLVAGMAIVPFAPMQGVDANVAQIDAATQSHDIDAAATGAQKDSFSAAEAPEPVVELSTAPAAGIPDPGSAQAIAYAMMPDYGWGDDQYNCLVALWSRESGWNTFAHNASSGAYGIPQALPGDKMASAGADWATNPATQITWGLGYIAGRYGTPCGAWGHSESVGWY